MQLKKFILESNLSNFLFFLFFFSHIYLWDLYNIFKTDNLDFFQIKYLRYLLLFFFCGVIIKKKFFDKNIAIFSFIFLTQLVINYFFYGQNLNLKELGSILFFIILYSIVKSEKDRILFFLKYFFELFILINFVGILIFLLSNQFKLVSACNIILVDSIIYHENSHFAMMATCMVVYYLNIETNFRNMFFLAILLFISFIYLSLTFMAGIFFSFMLCILINIFHNKKNNKIFIIGLILVLTTFAIKNDCTDRINYLVKKTKYNLQILDKIDVTSTSQSNENLETRGKIYNDLLPYRNLSSQVYNIAFHNTIYTLENRLLGWGFNAYHRLFEENMPNIMTKYYSLEYESNFKKHNNFELLSLNSNDARSTLLKIINEFGLFSIYFFIIGIKFLLNRSLDINFKLTISTLLITQFISGAGYFNGGFAIFLFLMIVLNDAKQRI